jgi:molybdopterin converting factor subunit 1
MRVTVRLFARLHDLTGTGEVIRELPAPATAHAVWKALVAEWPALREYEKTMSVAVNAEYARMTTDVHDGDEIAFLPPVSGGCDRSEVRAVRGPGAKTCSTS